MAAEEARALNPVQFFDRKVEGGSGGGTVNPDGSRAGSLVQETQARLDTQADQPTLFDGTGGDSGKAPAKD